MVHAKLPQARCDFYVYMLLRENGSPFYVGKGKGRRCRDHLRPHHSDTSPKARIVRRMAKAGHDVRILKVGTDLTEDQAFALERATIARIGRHPAGPLHNLTDGGEGASGHIHLPETKAVIGVAAKAYKSTPAARAAQSSKTKAAWADPDARLKMASAIKASATKQVRAAMAATLSQTMASPEWRAAHSARTAAGWAARPESRAAQGLRSKAAMADPAARQKLRDATNQQWADPEGRAKKLASWTPERRAAQAERCRNQRLKCKTVEHPSHEGAGEQQAPTLY